ncbi:hypothetical protein [Bartonella sp. LB28NMGDW]|uniref:hypothetical protein n=1 Tax=Bartonella sp. LB28NMGDW TaxID=3243549 RepID=UPI0035D07B22
MASRKVTLGGFIEDEDNLSHEANCWVSDEAMVYCGAEVYDSAKVFDNAKVAYFARVYGNAQVYDNAKVYGGIFLGTHKFTNMQLLMVIQEFMAT